MHVNVHYIRGIESILTNKIDRVQRLKDARAEAQKEIETLKRTKQEEYAAYERSVLGSLEGTVQEYTRETQCKLEEIRQIAGEKEGEVVKLLLGTVTKVESHIHRNSSLRMREGN